MAKFLTELNVRNVSNGLWELSSRLCYESDIVGMIIVEMGFQTDFASVPRVPIAYTLFGNRAHRESVIHDYLYRIDACPEVDRAQADNVFLEAMKERGKGYFVRYTMYWGVRMGGFTAWHKKKVVEENSPD